MKLPKPRATPNVWKEVTGYSLTERPFLLLVWQDSPDLGRVYLVHNSGIPADWLDLIWYCHGIYLDTETKRESNDSVTSMVQLLGLLTWKGRLPKKSVQIKHTNMVYRVRDLAGAWNSYLVPKKRLSRIKKEQVAVKIRTGRWTPANWRP